jgi:hypothetical protein
MSKSIEWTLRTLRGQVVSHIEHKKENPKMPQNLHWYSQYSGYPKGLLEYDEYLERVDELGNSGDPKG